MSWVDLVVARAQTVPRGADMHHLDKAVELPSSRWAALLDNMALDIAVLPGIAVVEGAVAEVEGVVADQVLVAPFFKLSYLLSCQFTSCGGEESSFLFTRPRIDMPFPCSCHERF